MDMISGLALLKKQWIIRERYDDVKIKMEKWFNDGQKWMTYAQNLCWSYNKGEIGIPMCDYLAEFFTELIQKTYSLIYQRQKNTC